MPSKTTWSVLVSIAWNVAQPYLPIAERWKPIVAFLSLCFLLLTITGWVFAHSSVLGKVRRAKGAKKKMALVIVGIIGAAGFVLLWLLVNKPATETPPSPPITTKEPPATIPAKQIPGSSPSSATAPAPAIQRHINTFSPKEIREQLAQTGPLELEDVSAGFLNGTVDWTLKFSAVHKTGSNELQVQFVPEGGPPPIVNCWVQLKGNEYLGRLGNRQPTFRVKGVTNHVELNIINLSEASVEQGQDVAPTLSPDASPPREVGPKNVPPKEPVATVHATTKQQEISALHKGRTAVKVMDLIKPYEGQTIDINGTLYQVQVGGGQDYYAILQNPEGDPVFVCHFKNEWAEKLRSLDQGAGMKVRGKIATGQNGLSVVLVECDLL
jgi:hypothetical protein